MSKYKDKESAVSLSFSGSWVSWTHTILAYAAFLSALFVGLSLHYHKIVQNEFWGYPQEWFPSVSATIGDKYPERAVFQLIIALTSGPRFALVALWYVIGKKPNNGALPKFQVAVGILRTLACGGFTYVTSTDDHDFHDVVMIIYLVGTIPWTACCIALSPPNPTAIKLRKYIASAFFGTIVPLVYFFIQHKVHHVAGAYTTYAFFEWSLILFDVGFDAVTALDFSNLQITISDNKGVNQGPNAALDKEKSKATAGAFDGRFSLMEVLDTVAEVYHGFVFWSMLTSLGLVIWYFPLWHMGISGYEALVMSTISPFFLGIKSIRSFVIHNLRIVHFLSLAGLAAWPIETPVLRLFTVGFGVFMSCLGWAATLYSESVHEGRLESKILAWTAGLILSSTAKFAWYTNNPVWPVMHDANNGYNRSGLAIAVVAAFIFTRRAPLNTGSPDPNLKGSAFLASLGVAGLFFGLHSLLSDTSTMILWVWEGYPIKGPVSGPHGWFTVAAMSAGLLTGIQRPQLAGSFLAYLVGCGGVAVLTLYPEWLGYSGALVTAFYLMAVATPLLTAGAKKSPAVVFGFGFLLYNFVVLFHVWVVAYAFVPGGPYVREHTDWVNTTMMFLIGAGVLNLFIATPRKAKSKGKKPASLLQHRKYHTWALGFVNVLFIIAAYMRFPTYDYKPYHPESKLITAGIWTIHFSLDNEMYSSEYRMRDLIKELELDVVGFLESDLQRIIMGNRDTTQFIAEDLGMYVDYGPGPNKHTWGSALLSKFPILNSTHHLLPSPVGELAPAIHATLDVYGELVDVFVFHSGQEEDPEDRRLQSEYLAKLMGESPRPSFLLSYLVTRPLQGNYNTYVSDKSGMHDVDPSDWDRWCEYILYKKLNRVGYARVSRHTITDTELQVAKFVVPTTPEEKAVVARLDGDADARNHRVPEHEVPPGWRFPAMFRGEGVRGHRYHVFNEPWYYKP
ncbi:Frag1/DRAM/Sfk1 family-domain-containing protein [Microdochium trichocladiopsis]|uniref:Frag1/DRAM/Sfk1 family-domain-containing protein n=1 Tax=Microdochium trichocladiopsis TaxID=1682393 RepID=A0A9P9BP45_9PEZI|nr:Frag1/DRAM/Sfk1 family-domain-containing protein [Microdochium trichocladiopsis]KAH7028872.1 Frag1/DRAM/Sfk1 family-domain-containing protein [Microdochium trichocladiopsis]